ncbi:MAG: pantoate--beta-alanine ligase [Alphaproteobacteria bacterium]|nr:pantoate--beta-alanine ligase [Alphaproteobacteria bacterium]
MSETIVRSVEGLRVTVAAWRRDGKTVGLVPTMGAIHVGHLSLVSEAKARCDKVIASIFVNPTQFGENEDFDAYPADEVHDVRELSDAGTDLVFCPGRDDVYPEGFSTIVSVTGVTSGLCGPFRPGHFDGVATVVAKLLLQCLPNVAVFGEKDYQQLLVIRQVARDLNIPVDIIGAPIIREADGLAMSSRNRYLSVDERALAPQLNRVLADVAAAILTKPSDCQSICRNAREELLELGFMSVDYVSVCDTDTLDLLKSYTGSARVFGAARLGTARLIDNLAIA